MIELIKIALDIFLKIFNIFNTNAEEKKKADEAVKKATSAYETTTDIPSKVREAHQNLRNKLNEAWGKRWGQKKEESQDS